MVKYTNKTKTLHLLFFFSAGEGWSGGTQKLHLVIRLISHKTILELRSQLRKHEEFSEKIMLMLQAAFQKILKAQDTSHLSKDYDSNVEPRKVTHNLSRNYESTRSQKAANVRLLSYARICLSNNDTRFDAQSGDTVVSQVSSISSDIRRLRRYHVSLREMRALEIFGS